MAKPIATYAPQDTALSRYFRESTATPNLSAEEEFALARAWRDHDDVPSLHRLTAAYTPFANKLAFKFRGYGLPLEDMVGEANIGLMQAAKRFDPDKGFRFSTYAQWWIRASMQQFVLANSSIVKMGTTAAQKNLFFNLRRLRSQIGNVSDSSLSDEHCAAIAEKLGVSDKEVKDMEQRLAGDVSLDAPLKDEEGSGARIDFMESASPTPEEIVAEKSEADYRGSLLASAMDAAFTGKNAARDRDVFVSRRLRDKEDLLTLEDLAQKYGVSRERIRQIEVKAFDKVQQAVLALSQG